LGYCTYSLAISTGVTDLTPTFLDYANVPHPGSTYNGTGVHPMMGKSIRPLINGSTAEIHTIDEPIGMEMFNNTAVYEGPWVAVNDKSHPIGKGWQLFNQLEQYV
jgi:arylsulfatase A-like enzyme